MTPLLRGFAIAVALILSARAGCAEAIKIVAVGASNTSGWGVSSQDAFPARLQTILRQRGIDATVVSAGIIGSTAAAMLGLIDNLVPDGTNIVVLQPGGNDLRFGSSKEQRAATIAAIVDRLQRRHIRVIVYDPEFPRSYFAWDGIHFTAATHAKIAKTLADQIADELKKPETDQNMPSLK
jgi:acyl-CoA thioesterase-1